MNINKLKKKNSKLIEVTLSIISKERFEIKSVFNESIIEFIKSINSRQYDINSRNWNILINDYNIFVKGLQNFDFVKIIGFPTSIIKLFQYKLNGRNIPPQIAMTANSEYLKVEEKIRACLFPFQVDGVKFMIGKNGRCLLADDMGLGKTIQSLGAASYYRNEWPLLVICPSSVKLAWRDQMKKWLSGPLDISVINTSRDINDDMGILDINSIVLISYDLVSKVSVKLMKKNFRVIIMDESHFIKEVKSARSKSCVPLLKKAKRVFLLSGTPALSRPCEMFTQIDCVLPSLYNGYFTEFGNRYCDPKPTQWGTSYLGSTNISELQIILEDNIMLRRIKSDVLSQLPEKHREVIILAPQFLKKAAIKRQTEIDYLDTFKSGNRHGALLKYFHETGTAKIDAIKNYIDDLIESPRKTLFFAHHTEVLNAVEQQLITKKIGYIRIDGSVNAEQKRERAEKFQFDDSIQVAVLSILAAGTGINLTAATLVVFGELFWNPGVLLQAENRCHRIGQKDLVTIHYLVAEKTADDYIWPLVQKKLELLSKVGINKESFKDSETMRLEESFSEKDGKQSKILEYFENDFFKDFNTNENIYNVLEESNNNSDKPNMILKESDKPNKKNILLKSKNISVKPIIVFNESNNKSDEVNIVLMGSDNITDDVSIESCFNDSIDWTSSFDEVVTNDIPKSSLESQMIDKIYEEENFDWMLNDDWQ